MFYIGYFNTLDKIKFGVDKKGRSYLGFTPINGTLKDPKKIKITYSGKQKGKLLAHVKINDTTTFPVGTIINVIGSINKENIIKLLKVAAEHKYFDNTLFSRNLTFETYSKNFVSIDPENSTDIDDGFYVDFPYLDIIIAFPYYFLNDKDILIKFNDAVSSRYGIKVEHLWGEEILNNASLLQNNKTVLMVLHYNLETKQYHINFYNGENKNQMSYFQVDNLKNNIILKWIDILNKYFTFSNSKELVKEIMILANTKFADFLEKNNAPLLYRKFILNHNFDNLDLPINIKQIFNQRKSDSAEYTLEKNTHELMNLTYSHFTSPLRRWVDCYHQMLIFKIIKQNTSDFKDIRNYIKNNILVINNKFNKIKKFHREYNYLIENEKLILKNKLYNGYVFNLCNNYLQVWCPEINRFIKIEFIHQKLLFQKTIIFNNKLNQWDIIDKINCSILTFKIGNNVSFEITSKTDAILPSKYIIGIFKKS